MDTCWLCIENISPGLLVSRVQNPFGARGGRTRCYIGAVERQMTKYQYCLLPCRGKGKAQRKNIRVAPYDPKRQNQESWRIANWRPGNTHALNTHPSFCRPHIFVSGPVNLRVDVNLFQKSPNIHPTISNCQTESADVSSGTRSLKSGRRNSCEASKASLVTCWASDPWSATSGPRMGQLPSPPKET